MRTAITTLLVTAAMTATAFAASGAPVAEPGTLCWACLGFCAAILVGQTIPAVMIMIKAFFGQMTPPEASHR